MGPLGGLGPYTIVQNPYLLYIYVAALFVPASNASYNTVYGSFIAANVPEPASIGLVAIALLGAATARRYTARKLNAVPSEA